MSRGTRRAHMSEMEEPFSQNNLRKKRVRPTFQFVQIKEAACTSILSRRWQYLWASTMTLNFDAVNFEVGNTSSRFGELKRESRDQQSFRYIGQNIERFRAHFFLDCRFKSSVDKWIQFGMERRVQILELEFLAEKSFRDEDYTFPQKLLGIISTKKGSALEQFLYSAWDNLLQSDIPSLYSCGYSIGFKSLKVLRLRHVRATEEFIEYLLPNSPVLERLSLNAAREMYLHLSRYQFLRSAVVLIP
ncbi:hypothetical protein PRUPE_4G126500 [Prunus persica]|uniref:At1g61320/AtMIF1 LRR domain-containing protein n=1 Tax=Prunus persica TaxID=3760 RepID=A0A251PJP4_PRUPE|nr:hypothetical protein PRUPE_4G126500 [Prunus persica]